MRTYYRRYRGFEGRRYLVRMPEAEVRGLVLTIVVAAAALLVILVPAAYLAGLMGR